MEHCYTIPNWDNPVFVILWGESIGRFNSHPIHFSLPCAFLNVLIFSGIKFYLWFPCIIISLRDGFCWSWFVGSNRFVDT